MHAFNVSDNANQSAIQRELNKLLPPGNRESTLEAFKQLSNKRPWIPFRAPDSTVQPTEIDEEVYRLFDLWEKDFKISGTPNYHAFANRWNNHVTKTFKEWTKGATVIIPRLKSALFLQQFKEKRDHLHSLATTLPNDDDDPDRRELRDTHRFNRGQLPPMPPSVRVVPPVFAATPGGITPFGNPHVMNADINVTAVTGRYKRSSW